MFEIVLLVYLSYRNSVRAKLKGLNGILWAFITAGAFMAALIVGGMFVIFNFCGDIMRTIQAGPMDPKSRAAASQQLYEALAANPLHQLTIEFFAIGGYLLVRYIIDKKEGKKKAEVHWMDKLGKQRES